MKNILGIELNYKKHFIPFLTGKYLILICIFGLFNISCQNHKTKISKKKLYEKKRGLIYLQGSNTPYTGEIRDTLEGRIVDYHVVNGIKDGKFKILNLDGTPQMQGEIVKGLNQGEWDYFYPNGKIESKGDFKNDKPSGVWNFYDSTGRKREVGEFTLGVKSGTWLRYDSTGKIIERKRFNFGVEIK